MVNKALIFGGIALLLIIIIVIILVLVLRPKPKPQPLPLPGPLPVRTPTTTPTTVPTVTSIPIITSQAALEICRQRHKASGGDPDAVNFLNPLRDCRFTYKATVGCPTTAKQLPDPTSAQGLNILSSRSANGWTQQTESAWLVRPGNNPSICRQNIFYYGTTPSADLCQQKCQLDTDCKSWTYVNTLGTFPDLQPGSCWGANAIEPRNTSTFRGFTSGGY